MLSKNTTINDWGKKHVFDVNHSTVTKSTFTFPPKYPPGSLIFDPRVPRRTRGGLFRYPEKTTLGRQIFANRIQFVEPIMTMKRIPYVTYFDVNLISVHVNKSLDGFQPE